MNRLIRFRTRSAAARVVSCFLLVLASILVGGVAPSSAATPSPGNPLWTHLNEDYFTNYDWASYSTSVDWAVSVVFVNNAEVDYVKSGLSNYMITSGSDQQQMLNDGNSAWYLDSDKGIKDGACTAWSFTNHMRLYADPDDQMYNISWGFYVLGTTHRDYQECSPWAYFGDSEYAEIDVAQYARQVWSPANVHYDYWNLLNPECCRGEGNHYWYNSGWATFVWV